MGPICEVHHWIIEPLTFREDFSYAEVVINETKPPKRIWFISHWWGEAPTGAQSFSPAELAGGIGSSTVNRIWMG